MRRTVISSVEIPTVWLAGSRAGVLALALAITGCVFGPRLRDLPPANTAAGARVDVHRHDGLPVSGELIGWTRDGVVIHAPEQNPPLQLVPRDQVRQLRIRGFGRYTGTAAQTGSGRARYAARYSQPIDDALLKSLLAAYGQSELPRAR